MVPHGVGASAGTLEQASFASGAERQPMSPAAFA
jgi:hypothetical protein